MQGKKVLLHANHGVIIATETIAEAFDYLYFLERAAEVQLKALSSGKPLKLIDEAVCIQTRDTFIKLGIAKEVSSCQTPGFTLHSMLCLVICVPCNTLHTFLHLLGAGLPVAWACQMFAVASFTLHVTLLVIVFFGILQSFGTVGKAAFVKS